MVDLQAGEEQARHAGQGRQAGHGRLADAAGAALGRAERGGPRPAPVGRPPELGQPILGRAGGEDEAGRVRVGEDLADLRRAVAGEDGRPRRPAVRAAHYPLAISGRAVDGRRRGAAVGQRPGQGHPGQPGPGAAPVDRVPDGGATGGEELLLVRRVQRHGGDALGRTAARPLADVGEGGGGEQQRDAAGGGPERAGDRIRACAPLHVHGNVRLGSRARLAALEQLSMALIPSWRARRGTPPRSRTPDGWSWAPPGGANRERELDIVRTTLRPGAALDLATRLDRGSTRRRLHARAAGTRLNRRPALACHNALSGGPGGTGPEGRRCAGGPTGAAVGCAQPLEPDRRALRRRLLHLDAGRRGEVEGDHPAAGPLAQCQGARTAGERVRPVARTAVVSASLRQPASGM